MQDKPQLTWIIGASSGIGAALARELAQRGHPVTLSARNADALEHLHQQLPAPAAGQPGHQVQSLDVSQADSLHKAQDQILQSWPTIHRTIYLAADYQPMPLAELDLSAVHRILSINLLGAYHTLASLLPYLLQQPPGAQIAFCASVAGYRGLPNSQPYAATKAGLINLAESLDAEHGEHLDIKLINPGFVDTRLTAQNTFNMPGCISPAQAACHIADGLNRRCFEIHFPGRLTYPMKLLRLLPHWLYTRIARRL
ncbi:MAG: SDR family NAD(P)-dependent oxidoreductase [Pseudomonadota bacterium]